MDKEYKPQVLEYMHAELMNKYHEKSEGGKRTFNHGMEFNDMVACVKNAAYKEYPELSQLQNQFNPTG